MRTTSSILLTIVLILTFPIWIGLIGGIFGLFMGIFGAIFGVIGAVFGGIFGLIGGIFGAVFGALGGIFGWVFHGFPFWNTNVFGILFVVLLIALVIKASQNKAVK